MLTNLDPMKGYALANSPAHVSMGVLLSPDAFRKECLRTMQKPTFDTWAIYAQLPDEVVRLMESPIVPRGAGLIMVASRAGCLYPIVVQQMAGLQMRTALCLQDDETQEWLRHCTERDTITMALEVDDTAHLAVLRSRCGQMTRSEAEAYIERCRHLPSDEFLTDASALARHLVDPKSVPTAIEGIEVGSVRLVLAFSGQQTTVAVEPEVQSMPLH